MACLFMSTFAAFLVGYFVFLISLFWAVSRGTAYIAMVMMSVNFMAFLSTMFGEMGVPISVYERYYKLRYVA